MMSSFDISDAMRIAIVGNSLVDNSVGFNSLKNHFPNNISNNVGARFDVSDYTVSNSSILYKSSTPYILSKKYIASLKSHSDLVIVSPGFMDFPYAVTKKNQLIEDFEDLFLSYHYGSSRPKVIILNPHLSTIHEDRFKNQSNVFNELLSEFGRIYDIDVLDINLTDDMLIRMRFTGQLYLSLAGIKEVSRKVIQYIHDYENNIARVLSRSEKFH